MLFLSCTISTGTSQRSGSMCCLCCLILAQRSDATDTDECCAASHASSGLMHQDKYHKLPLCLLRRGGIAPVWSSLASSALEAALHMSKGLLARNRSCIVMFCSQVSGEKEFFAQMVVDAVSCLDPNTLDLKMIGIKKVSQQSVNPLRQILTCSQQKQSV